jgi:hypothetical protein
MMAVRRWDEFTVNKYFERIEKHLKEKGVWEKTIAKFLPQAIRYAIEKILDRLDEYDMDYELLDWGVLFESLRDFPSVSAFMKHLEETHEIPSPKYIEVAPPEKVEELRKTLTVDILASKITEMALRRQVKYVSVFAVIRELEEDGYDVRNFYDVLNDAVRRGKVRTTMAGTKLTTPEAEREITKGKPSLRTIEVENAIIYERFRRILNETNVGDDKFNSMFDGLMERVKNLPFKERLKQAEDLARAITGMVKAPARVAVPEFPESYTQIHAYILDKVIERIGFEAYMPIAADVMSYVIEVVRKYYDEYIKTKNIDVLNKMIDEVTTRAREKMESLEKKAPPVAKIAAMEAPPLPSAPEVVDRIMSSSRAMYYIIEHGFAYFMAHAGGEFDVLTEFAGNVSAEIKRRLKAIGSRLREPVVFKNFMDIVNYGVYLALTKYYNELVDSGFGVMWRYLFDDIWISRKIRPIYEAARDIGVEVKEDGRIEYKSLTWCLNYLIDAKIYELVGVSPPSFVRKYADAAMETMRRRGMI